MEIAANVLARSKHAAPVPGEDEPDPFAEFVKGGIDEEEVRRDEVDRKPSQA